MNNLSMQKAQFYLELVSKSNFGFVFPKKKKHPQKWDTLAKFKKLYYCPGCRQKAESCTTKNQKQNPVSTKTY